MAKFKDRRRIGSGGFGIVSECVRDTDDEVFAKKSLPTGSDDESVRRFRKEVRILSRLNHPNIVRVVALQLNEEPFFYVMPIYAKSLFDELSSIARDENRIVRVFGQILDGMEYAHSQGVAHRDLKPENVLMNGDDDVVISDFGLGLQLDSNSTRQTLTGDGLGTLLYMAPEQLVDAKRTDERSDIYSLGRMLFEFYGGQLTVGNLDLSGLPAAVVLFIQRCTHNDSVRRFQSIGDMKIAWERLTRTVDEAAEETELQGILAEVSAQGSAPRKEAEHLLELLVARAENRDLIHEALMSIPTPVLTEMYDNDPAAVGQLVEIFVKLMMEQGWPYEYTDRIGNRCRDLHQFIADPEVRAALVACTVAVGAGHNRWHVIGIAEQLIQEIKDEQEAAATARRLGDLNEWYLEAMKNYLDVPDVHEALRPLFE